MQEMEEGEMNPEQLQGMQAHMPSSVMQNQMQQQHLQQLHRFWSDQMHEIEEMTQFKQSKMTLPLARIKKIMKFDEDVKMISAEAPVLFAKACEMFIHELTLRAWIHTDENKRRTLQRNDIATAIARNDTFDFLIDIVPRDDIKGKRPAEEADDAGRPVVTPELQQYYLQMQQHAALQQQAAAAVDPAQAQRLALDPTQMYLYQQQQLRYIQQAQMLQHMQMQQQGQMGDQIDHDQMNEMGSRQLEVEGVEGQDLGDGHIGHGESEHGHHGQGGHEYSNGGHHGHPHEHERSYHVSLPPLNLPQHHHAV
jgi:nuclear transcription factor Y gamma